MKCPNCGLAHYGSARDRLFTRLLNPINGARDDDDADQIDYYQTDRHARDGSVGAVGLTTSSEQGPAKCAGLA